MIPDNGLARLCVETLVRELGAAECLERLLAPVADRDVKPANVMQRDPKPQNKPTPGRKRGPKPKRAPGSAVESEAARLVRLIETRHGGLAVACARFGFNAKVMNRWRKLGCSPRSLERLRTAAAADVLSKAAGREGEDAGDEPAPQDPAA